MKRVRIVVIIMLCIIIGVAAVKTRSAAPRIRVSKDADNRTTIDIVVSREHMMMQEMPPLVLMEFNGSVKLADFNKRSILTTYGFQKDDIITAIDGEHVDSVAQAITICNHLAQEILTDRKAREVNVSLMRNGADVSMNFKIPAFIPESVSYEMRLKKQSGR